MQTKPGKIHQILHTVLPIGGRLPPFGKKYSLHSTLRKPIIRRQITQIAKSLRQGSRSGVLNGHRRLGVSLATAAINPSSHIAGHFADGAIPASPAILITRRPRSSVSANFYCPLFDSAKL
jgi:hypothetical protein